MNEQSEVYDAVVARGYRDGWSAGQFLARQVGKLTEELGEVGDHIGLDRSIPWIFKLKTAANWAEWSFDRELDWEDVELNDLAGLAGELADIQIVLFCAASALGELLGKEFDLVNLAVEKSKSDIRRGVRSNDE